MDDESRRGEVQEASEDSFPASDAPGWVGGSATGPDQRSATERQRGRADGVGGRAAVTRPAATAERSEPTPRRSGGRRRGRPLAEQVVVVTGASSGIGLATAREAARRGARVVVAARSGRTLDQVVTGIREDGGHALAAPTDVTDMDAVEGLAERTLTFFGRIDTWINNAGVLAYGPFESQPLEDFRRVMDVNFMGQVHGARAALPHLEESAGALICVGSAFSDRGAPLWSAYSASKHALKGWIDALRVELRERGSPVRVTLVKPSTINTPLFDHAKTYEGVKPIGLPPIYAPELVARAILAAAEGEPRDVCVGEGALMLSLGQRLSPRMVDAHLGAAGFEGTRSRELRSPEDPNNLYEPMDGGEPRLRSSLIDREMPFSPYELVREHPVAAGLAIGGVVAALALRGRAPAG